MGTPPRVIRPDELASEPWANGAGRTKVIHAQTEAHSNALLWRISIAEITRTAPFSTFPGLDRAFTLATGGPLSLAVGDTKHVLTLGQTLTFAGESPTKADLRAAGTQLVLNLMTRRLACQGTTTAHLLNGEIILDPATGAISATVLSGYATVHGGPSLPALATLILGEGATILQTRNCLLAVSSVQMHPKTKPYANAAASPDPT
ncbi:HutD/Ves family protein [Arthrobacter sp. HMWF013]|uniref:HutD/Ves family protein n=1 Tax=Arthrobacter sp. HMWF013 TaxID=2056849 RepID=UPI0015E7E6EA|nr:HutD family protein [Arthrobacter sp. HMWF013]